jgi:hypothetical protein
VNKLPGTRWEHIWRGFDGFSGQYEPTEPGGFDVSMIVEVNGSIPFGSTIKSRT